MCVCVCVCERERERKREANTQSMASMKQQRQDIKNEYQGYCIPPPPNESSAAAVATTSSSSSSSQPPPRDGGSLLDIIHDPNHSMTSKEFFNGYISKRKPCILNGLPPLSSSSSSQVSSLKVSCQDLINVAGDKVRKRFLGEHKKKERESIF